MEKNLRENAALSKFKKLVNDIKTCMFITNSPETDHTRPMATIEVDEEGRLWFFTDIRSIKVEEVKSENSVHLVYAHPGKESYLDVWGRASVNRDREQIKNKWSPIVKAWFPKGVEDPNIALLVVQPDQAYYWDAESGKMVAFIKMAAAAVAGTKPVTGAEGKLEL